MYEPLMHEIDVHSHLPPALDDIEEFIEITKVENKNFNRARIDLLSLFKMRFVHEADETGLARWEKMLKIKRRATDTLDIRKMRVLSKINNKLPYTLTSLKQLLNAVFGENNYDLKLDSQTFEMELLLPISGHYKEIVDILEPMIPLNIWMTIAEGLIKEIIQLIVGTYSWQLNGRVCGKFRTAARPGHFVSTPSFENAVAYSWPIHGKVTGRFKAGGGTR